MAVLYVLTEERQTVDEKVNTVYGIAACVGAEPLLLVPCISTDQARVEELIQTCNRLALSPLHLRDVVEDFLAQ